MSAFDFVLDETQMLEAGEYAEWLELWDQDCVYWAPFTPEAVAPDDELNLIFDDHARLSDRVGRLLSGDAHAQDPPSVTSRLMGPIRSAVTITAAGWSPAGAYDEAVTAHFALTEIRRGQQRQYAGTSTYWLRRDGASWRIAAKRVDLLQARAALGNLTILL